LILNISVGGGWPDILTKTTVFPQQMVVDYVRVYQKINILTGKTGKGRSEAKRAS